jgi:dolichyl-phosphate beta-glucosyltransferase
MHSPPSVSIIIPCFNEVDRLLHLMDGIKYFIAEWHGDFEFIIINDSSSDDTYSRIENIPLYQSLSINGKAQLINNLPTRKGKGGALKTGIEVASKDYILTCDADMATEPIAMIIWFIKYPQLFDHKSILIASRTHPESQLELISDRRSHGNLFNRIVRLLTPLELLDTQCGFKLYPCKMAKSLFASLKTMGWAHDVEILCRASKLNFSIHELPILWSEREASKINLWSDGIRMVWEVVKFRLRSMS